MTLHQPGKPDANFDVAVDDQKDLAAPPPSASSPAGTCSMQGSGPWATVLEPATGPDVFGNPPHIARLEMSHTGASTTCRVTLVDASIFEGPCDGANGADGNDLRLAIVGMALSSSTSGDTRTLDVQVAMTLHNCG